MSFDLFRRRCLAIVSWGVHDLFFLQVCSWGRLSEVWCCPFFQDGWSNFVCIWISRLVFQRSLFLFLWLRFLFCPVLCILWHFLQSASLQLLGESCLVSWLPMFCYRTVVLVWLRLCKISFGCLYGFFCRHFLTVPHILWNLFIYLFIFLSKSGSPSKLSSHPK